MYVLPSSSQKAVVGTVIVAAVVHQGRYAQRGLNMSDWATTHKTRQEQRPSSEHDANKNQGESKELTGPRLWGP
jgi:hypothetical protein